MKINVARSAGFCFGVRRAIHIAMDAARSGDKVCMLGDIVHNEDVVKQIELSGIKKIKRLAPAKNKVLLIRAHGTSSALISKAKRMGYRIIDATCPMVRDIHRIAQGMENRGYGIIVIGDKKHDEVQGIIGNIRKGAIVIDDIKHIPVKRVGRLKKAGIVVQSTQNLDKVLNIVRVLKKYIPELEFTNTICSPTRAKQDEIKKLPLENDVMIIIGSRNSANTRRLYEISRSQNSRSFWVNSKEEIKKAWFKDAQSVGITAGASTPESTIRNIVEYIQILTGR